MEENLKSNSNHDSELMEKIVSLCKRRGFVFAGSDIYGGLAGTWDYGVYGAEMVHKIKDLWWKHFVRQHDEVFGITTSTLMSEAVWKASGHLSGFTDPIVECNKCHHRFRADHLSEETRAKKICPDCGGTLGEEKVFNLMLPVNLGATNDGSNTAYLRGEIAQGMFIHFKNILDTKRPKLPFGLAQIGKAYRNEIAPRDFLFRVREFDLMEFEYFVREEEWAEHFEKWRLEMWDWVEKVGLDREKVHELEIAPEDRAHYSKRTIDFEFDYPFGRKELYGLAYRTDHDLKNHAQASGVELSYFDEEKGERFTPHVIEPSFGNGRTLLAVLVSAYTEVADGDETRVFLKLKPKIAPVTVAVFPLLKNKPVLVEKAREIYKTLRAEFDTVEFDDNGNIGKRYRRQDEIGTPFCVTVDFDTIEKDNTVTVRDRDTGEQSRVAIDELVSNLKEKINK